jgi:HEPN domain-containing protein
LTGQDDSLYRLKLAERSLELAEQERAASRWREAALFARAAIEHAAKSVAACFGPVPRSHEPGAALDVSTTDSRFPAALLTRAGELRPKLAAYGLAEHILLSYGDEQAHIDPWSLVTEAHAKDSLCVAKESVDLSRDCIRELFGNNYRRG